MLNRIFRRLGTLLLLTLALSFIGARGIRRYSDAELSKITRRTVEILSANHYRQRKIDLDFSRHLFDQYLDTLDPNKMYFTTADVKRFASRRDTLHSALARGDNSFAFELYEAFRKRHDEFLSYAEKMLRKPIDFTVKESYTPDRSKAPRCANDAELHEVWRKRIKNDVLFFKLLDRVLKSSHRPEDKKALAEAKAWDGGRTPADKVLKRLKDFANEIQKRDRIDILGLYLNALARLFGPHSNYLPPRLDQDFEINMSLSLFGIGATLTSDDGFVKIVSLVRGGPADLDGKLKVNDRIIAVTQEDGETQNVINMPLSQAVQLIRGPENTKVTLTVLSGSKSAVPKKITLTRAKVRLVDNEAKGKIVSRNGQRVGIITLPSFYMDFEAVLKGDPDAKRCSTDVKKILADFKAKKVDAVVIDLRRNGGGSLPEAINMTGLFIKTGPVVQVRSRRGTDLEIDEDPEQAYSGPLVLLTSKLSASASEIFTAALRDCNQALVVGDSRTFGKGTVLQVEQIERPSFFRRNVPSGSTTFEIAMFYRTAGGSVQQLGIAPDIRLPSLTEELKVGEMFMENHLPWDSIDPVNREFHFNLSGMLPALRKKSAERIKKSPEYAKLLRRIELYKRYKQRNEISLNEAERWKDYQEEKQLSEAEDKALDEEPDKTRKGPDPILNEATRIAADLAVMEKKNTRCEKK